MYLKNYIKPNGVKIDTLTESKISVKTDFVGMGNINVKYMTRTALLQKAKVRMWKLSFQM